MKLHLGIDIGGTWIKYGAIDDLGHILYSNREATHPTDPHRSSADVIVNCAHKMIEWAKVAGHSAGSIGIGSPGTINPVTKKVQPPTPNLTTIIGINLAELIERATEVSAVVDNDANCAAWGEYCYGAGRGIDNLICITVGSGIGSGFIINGRIFSGPHGSGGELGHVTIDHDGPGCPCGNRGCLELYASARAISNAAGGKSIADIFRGTSDGDKHLNSLVTAAARALGFGILNAIQILDPEAVLIGGGVADADTDGRWLKTVADTIHAHAFSHEGKNLPIGKAALGNDAGFIGAAALGAQFAAKSD